MNWSGGKDSALCLYKALQSGQYNVSHLLTSVNSVHDRISMHGVRRSLLLQQAAALGLPLHTIELPEQPGMAEYETAMLEKVTMLKNAGCTHALFGDIFLEDLRVYRENKLKQAGIQCVFPLWKQSTAELAKEFIALGFKSVIVCVNEQYLDRSFCGRVIDEAFLNDLPANVDPCGENGEFHSFVYEAPMYKNPIAFTLGETIHRTYEAPKTTDTGNSQMNQASAYGFYFTDLLPA
ncbi:diphthine--ammonia ligase [Deminuibacter soli]|uniref:Diphthine--ammonia ligase n=2 Tax=Deminuibacter soli TaxID=2291815 RepID=A0A3E1NFZ4_9BACT|nr:diphthine--ammonia ligase [Deminuibacter soli]